MRRLWAHMEPRRRIHLAWLLLVMVCASFAEIVSIGAVLPFLAILTEPDRVFAYSVIQPLIQFLGITTPNQLLLPLTIAFASAAVLAGVMRLILLWFSTRLSFAIGAELGIGIYRRTLFQDYAIHIARNSSEIIDGISNKTKAVTYSIMMVLALIGSGVMLVGILAAMLSVDPIVAVGAFAGFGLIYAVVIRATRNQLQRNGERIARQSTEVIKCLQEGLGGIRDVLIDGSQDAYCEVYRKSDITLKKAESSNVFISGSPRYGTEALGMLLIATIAYFMAQREGGIATVIPILGGLAIGAQRLLPVLQQAYSSWASIRGLQVSLQDALDLLDQPLPGYADQPILAPMPFQSQICLSQLSFRYGAQTPWVFRKLELNIPKGSRIGFIGATGSGKSTLLDVVMALLQPTEGELSIDGRPVTQENQRAWQAHIAHVPQAIFLSDSSIEENIAFSVPKAKIDRARVQAAALQAQIAADIEKLTEKYQTLVGERGIRMSGGQRQRIGIARALYKQADVIIFDEATSALDSETEKSVMESIEKLNPDLTLLIIAHRLSTLKNCTKIVELGDGGIRRVGTYQTIVSQAA